MREVRQRVTLLETALGCDLFIASRKRNWLERQEGNLLRIVEGKSNNGSDLVVIDAVDQCGNEHNLNARFMQVIDCTHLHIEQIANLAMAVGVITNSVKLEVNVAQTSLGSFATEIFALSKFDSV